MCSAIRIAAEAVMAWSTVQQTLPGRMKARRHCRRTRDAVTH
ncbi:hypothetical protein [Streptomyces sp. NPDC001980]